MWHANWNIQCVVTVSGFQNAPWCEDLWSFIFRDYKSFGLPTKFGLLNGRATELISMCRFDSYSKTPTGTRSPKGMGSNPIRLRAMPIKWLLKVTQAGQRRC